jgi:GT2 family glycosyltransferase
MTDQRSERRRASSCFVIATRNRPDYLLGTLRSLVEQTVLPAELCIVDSSAETPARAEIEGLCAEHGIELRYVHPAPRGLPAQRNIGIDETRGDPVFLIDDDVLLAPDVHEEVLAEYERWGPELGGVRAAPVHPPDPGRLTILWRRLFGMGGWWPEGRGRMRHSFLMEGVASSRSVREVDAFNGWFMSYRRAVFEHERFDETLRGYAFREDMDFSYRVRRRGYVLVQTPKALVEHLKAPAERLPPYDLQRMMLGNQFYLHRKNIPQTARNTAALWWALTGMAVLNAGKAVRTRDHGWFSGFVVGAWEQARGKGLVDPTERSGE